jgi:hypothetical protein
MKDRIEQSLASLVGLPMWVARRAADMEMFQFGDRQLTRNRRGEPAEVGQYALHVQCTWRLLDARGIIAASQDCFYPAGDPDNKPPDFEWDKAVNRRDERMAAFFATCGNAFPVVQRVEADRLGSLRVVMSGEVTLEVFPDNSLEEEHWRFFRPASDEKHLVVTGRGLDFH